MSANCLLLRRKHALAYRRRAVFHPMLSPHFDLDFLFSLSLISLSLPFLHFAFLILSFIPFSFYLVFLLSCFFSSFAVSRPFSQSAVHFLSIFVSFPPILPFFSSPFSYSSLLFCLSFPAHFTFCTFTLYSDLLTVVTAWMRTSRAHSVCSYWMNCLYWCRTPPLAASSPTAYSLERPPSPKRKNSGKEQRLCWWKLNSI